MNEKEKTVKKICKQIVKDLKLDKWDEQTLATLIYHVNQAYDEGVLNERSACIQELRPDYPDAVKWLQIKREGR